MSGFNEKIKKDILKENVMKIIVKDMLYDFWGYAFLSYLLFGDISTPF